MYAPICDVCRLSELITLGNMELSDEPPYNLSSGMVDVLIPDKYNPGSFFFNKLGGICRYTKGVGVTVIAGSPTERGLKEGPALLSRFNLITDILQHKRDKLVIVDFRSSCIRELNMATSRVRTFIGSCQISSRTSPNFIRMETADQNVSARAEVMNHPLQVVYVEKGDYYIFFDMIVNNLLKMDVRTDTVACLNADLNKGTLYNIINIIVDTKQKYLYITHGYALSKLDLDTLEIELLAGVSVNDNGRTPNDFQAGPFSTAYVGRLGAMVWIIPDQVMAAITGRTNEAITLIDLVNKEISAVCPGKFWQHNNNTFAIQKK